MLVKGLLGLVLLLGFVAPVFSDSKEKQLLSRVEARWALIAEGEYLKVYEYETPNFKKVFSGELFAAKFGYDVKYKMLDVIRVEIDKASNLATVVVNIATSSAGAKKDINVIPVVFNEKWLHIDGQWWHSFDK